MKLSELEMAVMTKLLGGRSADKEALLAQLQNCSVISREYTGCGFFTRLSIDERVPASESKERELIQGVRLTCAELEHGAGFILFMHDGYLRTLEGYTYVDDEWPEKVSAFELS